jgi:negative regulator of sigma E activity
VLIRSFCTLTILLAASGPDAVLQAADLASVEELLAKMRESEETRTAALPAYTAMRQYTLENPRFHKTARVTARIRYTAPGVKTFELLSEDGSPLLCDKVLKRIIHTEAEVSRSENRSLSRIDETNYELRILGTEIVGGRLCIVLDLTPKSKSPYLVKGRAWIDAAEHAVVRVAGVLAKRPSVWVGAPLITQNYTKSGPFWLPSRNVSTTDAPIFGRTDVTIESTQYEIEGGQQ